MGINSQSAYSSTLREYVERIFIGVIEELPDGAARLVHTKASNGDDVLSIVPTEPNAAEIYTHIAENGVDFGFGRDEGCWELFVPSEAEWTEKEDWLRTYCNAIVRGESGWRKGFLSNSSVIWVDGKETGIRSFFHFRLIPSRGRYAPYVPK